MSLSLLQEEPYLTPAGSVDLPYAYVFDATSLTDGQDYQSLQVQISGDSDFILRRIAGVPLCVDSFANGGRFNYQNASRSYSTSAKLYMGNNFGVLPEKRYPRNSSIYLDLFQVKRLTQANAGSTIYMAQIGFFGVRRYSTAQGGGGIIQQVTPYRYKEKRFSYEYSLTINQGHYTLAGGTITTPAQRFVIPVNDFDFELMQIQISNTTGNTTVPEFAIQLYDPGMHLLSSAPLQQWLVNSLFPASGVEPTEAEYQSVFPVPSIVWPVGGNIVFDVTSNLPNSAVPQSYTMSFTGVRRIPC